MPIKQIKSQHDLSIKHGEWLASKYKNVEYKLLELSDLFVSLEDNPLALEEELHKRAQSLLDENKLEEAWLTLLSFNN